MTRKILAICLCLALLAAVFALPAGAWFSVPPSLDSEMVAQVFAAVEAFNRNHGGQGRLTVALEESNSSPCCEILLITGTVTGATRGLDLQDGYGIRWQATLEGNPTNGEPLLRAESIDLWEGELVTEGHALEVARLVIGDSTISGAISVSNSLGIWGDNTLNDVCVEGVRNAIVTPASAEFAQQLNNVILSAYGSHGGRMNNYYTVVGHVERDFLTIGHNRGFMGNSLAGRLYIPSGASLSLYRLRLQHEALVVIDGELEIREDRDFADFWCCSVVTGTNAGEFMGIWPRPWYWRLMPRFAQRGATSLCRRFNIATQNNAGNLLMRMRYHCCRHCPW